MLVAAAVAVAVVTAAAVVATNNGSHSATDSPAFELAVSIVVAEQTPDD